MSKEQQPKVSRRQFLRGLALLAGGILLNSSERKEFVLSEEDFYSEISRVFGKSNGERDLITGYIIDSLKKSQYLTAGNNMKGKYYASGLTLETRNPEMLELIGQVKNLARQKPGFDEKNWVIEEDNSLYSDIVRAFGEEDKGLAEFVLVCLEEAKTIDPEKSPQDLIQRQNWYSRAKAIISTFSVAGPFTPERRNPEMLRLLSQVESMA